jgi:hypothetical protein
MTKRLRVAVLVAFLLSCGLAIYERTSATVSPACAALTPDDWFWWFWYGCDKDSTGGGGSGAGD